MGESRLGAGGPILSVQHQGTSLVLSDSAKECSLDLEIQSKPKNRAVRAPCWLLNFRSSGPLLRFPLLPGRTPPTCITHRLPGFSQCPWAPFSSLRFSLDFRSGFRNQNWSPDGSQKEGSPTRPKMVPKNVESSSLNLP